MWLGAQCPSDPGKVTVQAADDNPLSIRPVKAARRPAARLAAPASVTETPVVTIVVSDRRIDPVPQVRRSVHRNGHSTTAWLELNTSRNATA
jgi:hypothetical protein